MAGSSRVCYFNSCQNLHALAVTSGQEQLNKFSCAHLEKVKDSMPSREEHHLNSEKYPGGADILRNMTDAADYAKQLGVPQVIRVSGSSYMVCGIPDTSATTGFVHVKSHNDTLLCSVKHCRIFSGGKQLKTWHCLGPIFGCSALHVGGFLSANSVNLFAIHVDVKVWKLIQMQSNYSSTSFPFLLWLLHILEAKDVILFFLFLQYATFC